MLAMVAIATGTPGRRSPFPLRQSSPRCAVAAAVSAPTPIPVMKRATSSTGTVGKRRKSTAATASSTSAKRAGGFRPTQSETCPTR